MIHPHLAQASLLPLHTNPTASSDNKMYGSDRSSLTFADVLSKLHLHPVHGDAPQQGVLLWQQPNEGSDWADAAQLRDAAGPHLHAPAGPLHPAAQRVRGQLTVSEPDPDSTSMISAIDCSSCFSSTVIERLLVTFTTCRGCKSTVVLGMLPNHIISANQQLTWHRAV